MDWEHRFAEGFPLYVSVSRPPLHLHLSEHEGGGTREAELFVRVPDVDAVHRAVVAAGYAPDGAPVNQDYGMRDFGLTDPDGHHITLGTPVSFPTEHHREPDLAD